MGGLALGGLSLSQLMSHAGSSVNGDTRPVTSKSVVFLFLHGGPSQIETFDPKMTAPDNIRSATGETKTVLPGITFGGTFPKLAARADRFSVVRSFVTGDGNHDIKPVMSKDSGLANLGSAYASVAGANHPITGLPTNLALFPQSVEPTAQPMQKGFGNFLATGPFGAGTTPFVPGAGGASQKNLTLNMSQSQLTDRRTLLTQFDQAQSSLERMHDDGELESTREKAFSMLLRGTAEAFDLRQEHPQTVQRYDTEPLYDISKINKKWNNHKFYADNARTLGKLLLLSRRLVERGAGFITISTNFVWDMHADENNATMTEGMGYMAPGLDHAVSAFLDDLRDRGLDEQVLFVMCGEMGRTPKINKNGGRDHWGNLAPLLMAGGGYQHGAVIGTSDREAGTPTSEPIRIKNLLSTITHTLFDVGKLRVTRGVSRELMAMADVEPIELK